MERNQSHGLMTTDNSILLASPTLTPIPQKEVCFIRSVQNDRIFLNVICFKSLATDIFHNANGWNTRKSLLVLSMHSDKLQFISLDPECI